MAVPKRKTSKSKKGMRQGGNGTNKLILPNITVDKDTGEYKLPHNISLDGYYNGKQVIEEKIKEENEEEK